MRRWLVLPVVFALLPGCGEDDKQTASERFREQVQEAKDQLTPAQIQRINERAREKTQQVRERARTAGEADNTGSGSGGKGQGGGAGGFTGVDAGNYKVAKSVCGAFPKDKVATDLNLPANSDVFTIAQKYADGYRPALQQANFEGCLAGLQG